MNEWLTLALAWMAGLLLGAIFFGGLWWTVRLGVASRRPALAEGRAVATAHGRSAAGSRGLERQADGNAAQRRP